MLDPVRQEIAVTASMVVVKVGTRVLTAEDGALDVNQVDAIAEQIARLVDQGRQVVLVSSGAVGAGIGRLKIDRRPDDLAQLQAVAAVGQSCLIEVYNRSLERYGRHAAQVLMTVDDLNDRSRYLNARNTLHALFAFGAVPIVNENDTVRVDELQRSVGDNDRMAALVTNLLRAPLLVLLSDIEGLYDGDPLSSDSQVIPLVEDIDSAIAALDRTAGAKQRPIQLSTGGIASKLEAARIATTAGENVLVANGRRPQVLQEIFAGDPVGTLFLAKGASLSSRKRWIGWTPPAKGTLRLDAGARRAITDKGSSLLAIGITHVEGDFEKGDVLTFADEKNIEFARGLTNYNSTDLAKICGQSTDRFEVLLGHCPYKEVVHRDNLTLIR